MKNKSPNNISPKIARAFETPLNWNEELAPKDFYADPSITVLFRDEFLIVVNKPAGILVHPINDLDPEKKNLLKLVKWQSGQYLYPIHRLDRPVSGIVIFALDKKIAKKIKENWHQADFLKEYTALVIGITPESGVIEFPLEDAKGMLRESKTTYQCISTIKDRFSLIKIQIQTGRNHQIRRHFKMIGHAIVGDILHGDEKMNEIFSKELNFTRIFLQASKIQCPHPKNQTSLVIECGLDQELLEVIGFIDSHSSLI